MMLVFIVPLIPAYSGFKNLVRRRIKGPNKSLAYNNRF